MKKSRAAITQLTVRVPEDVIFLSPKQVCRLIAKRKKVSANALQRAMSLLQDGMIELLASGYGITWTGFIQLFVKEVPARNRYSRTSGQVYKAEPTTTVHLKKASGLKEKVRKLAAALQEGASEEHILAIVNPSKASGIKVAERQARQFTPDKVELRKKLQ